MNGARPKTGQPPSCQQRSSEPGKSKWEEIDPMSRPVRFTASNGGSIARRGAKEGGAVGGWLKNGSGRVFGFSNNHVIAALNQGRQNDSIWHAGTQIGNLHSWIRLEPPPAQNRMDLALFALSEGEPWRWRHPRPVGWMEPKVNQLVYRVDRSGNLRKGIITTIGRTLVVPFGARSFEFKDIIAIRPTGPGPFSSPGDSGSLVMTAGNLASSVLFACTDDPDHSYSFAFPWASVADLLPNYRWA